MRKTNNDLLFKYVVSVAIGLVSLLGYFADDRLTKIDKAFEKLEKLEHRLSAEEREQLNNSAHIKERVAKLEAFSESIIRAGCDRNCQTRQN